MANYEPWYSVTIDGGPVAPPIEGCEPGQEGAWCKEGDTITVNMPTA
jgi:hypothetical protein